MKLLKTSAVVIGLALCAAACSKSPTQNSADENAADNVEAPVAAPAPTTPAQNASDMNAVVQNNAAAPETARKHHHKGDRTDNGPRPPSTTN